MKSLTSKSSAAAVIATSAEPERLIARPPLVERRMVVRVSVVPALVSVERPALASKTVKGILW